MNHLARYWYAACFASELGSRRPLGRTVHGRPMVLFRDAAGNAVALVDRCPHRNAPLSMGHAEQGELRCAYHGWKFDGSGACTEIPGIRTASSPAATTARRVESYPARERDGIVWVVPSHEPPALAEPPPVPHADDEAYATVRHAGAMRTTVVAAVENALDVPHTAFLHRGLFRGRRAPVPVDAVVRHGAGTVEAEYVGEPVPPGIAARLLAPPSKGGAAAVVEHVDRFVAPSMAQVEYRLGTSHLIVTTAFTPVDDDNVALLATVCYRSPLPAAVIAPVVTPIAKWILRQDARMLAAQHDNVRRFGGEHFVHTPIDVLGPHIARLVRRAERGEPLTAEEGRDDERVTLYV